MSSHLLGHLTSRIDDDKRDRILGFAALLATVALFAVIIVGVLAV
jgi:hypothetical protein